MPEDYGAQAPDMTVRDYMDLFRRRKAIILQTFVVVVSVGLVITMMAKPVFQSGTSILVEGKRWSAPGDQSGVFAGIFTPDMGHSVDTQLAVLSGRSVTESAYKLAELRPGSVSVRASQQGETEVVNITCQSMDKVAAYKMAVAMPEAYAKHLETSKKAQVVLMLKFAKERLREEEGKLSDALNRMQAFKARYPDPEAQIAQRLAIASAHDETIRTLTGQVAAAKAALDTLDIARRSEPDYIETPVESTNVERQEMLRTRLEQLQTDRAAQLLRFKPSHLSVQQIDAQIGEVRKSMSQSPPVRKITREPNPRIPEYNSKLAEARATLESRKAELAQMLAKRGPIGTAALSKADRDYTELRREVESLSATVSSMKRSVEDLDMKRIGIEKPPTIISEAGPAAQVAPKPMNNFITAALVGIMLGICLALLQEYLDDRINSPEDARRILDAPILSYVPLVEQPEARLLHKPSGGGSLLESYRVMRSNVQFATVDSKTSSIVITSTAPGEGKSVTATNLAIAMALDGRRVILVDADLRRPTLHEKLDTDHRPGLTNVLVGRSSLEEALKDTGIPGLSLLASGPLPPNPAELLNSRAMAQLHEELREMADVVIFDSPPFLATADAQVLSSMADGVIYVVQLGDAKKSPVKHSSELMRQAHARVLGIVFNKIDLKSRRDDYYYGYYRYYNYYQTPQLEDGKSRRRSTEEFEALASGGPSHPDLRSDQRNGDS